MVLRLNSSHTAFARPSDREELAPSPLPELGWDRKIVQAVQTGLKDLTEPGFVVPMVFAQGVFGFSRLGLLRLMSPAGVSRAGALLQANLGAFALEGLAFAGSAEGVNHVMGRELVPGTSFAKELGNTYLTMGLLKILGGVAKTGLHLRYAKIPAALLSLQDKAILTIAPQAAQFAGIYLSHTLAPGLGLGEYIRPGERAIQSAVTLMHFGAAGHLLNRIPGYAAANQKIHQEAENFIQENWNHLTTGRIPSLAASGIGPVDLGSVRSPTLSTDRMLMNSSNNNGPRKGPVEIIAVPISDSEPPPSTLKRVTVSRFDLTKYTLSQEETELAPPEASDALLGQIIDGRYHFESVLGIGGTGKVYLGRHMQLNKKVAIKVLLKELARREDMNQRFFNEARAASMIGNPHIVDVSDFGQLPNGSTYFVMEFLQGRSLGELTEAGKPLPLDQVLNISRQVTEAMAAAHEVNIVHRDLKPDNIFLSQRGSDMEFVKILDFGIAKFSADSKLTIAGEVVGSPYYLSPEQASGAKTDHRSDIYSMGIILYEMATGRVPFVAEDYADVLRMHMTQEPPPPRTLLTDTNKKDLPPGLEAVILKCLRKKPAERYQSMSDLNAELVMMDQGLRPAALFSIAPEALVTSAPVPYALKSHGVMKDWRVWAGIAGAALLGGGAVALLRRGKDGAPSAMPSVPTPPPDKKDISSMEAQHPTPPSSLPVKISVHPVEAHVFIGGQDHGAGEISIEIPAGKKLDVEVRRRGYKSENLSLDGSMPEVSVKLRPQQPNRKAAVKPPPISQPSPTPRPSPIPQPSPTPRPSPTPKTPPSSVGSDGVVRPW